MEQTQNPIYASETLEFVTVAAEYCKFLEQCEGMDKAAFITTMQRLLTFLYLKVQFLPEVDSQGDFLSDVQLTEEGYNWVRQKIYQIMGEDDDFEDLVYDESTGRDEIKWKSVSEELADIYQALINMTGAYQQRVELSMLDALWEVKENYELYWGTCVIEALKALHKLKIQEDGNA